jgi:hypothetical protein
MAGTDHYLKAVELAAKAEKYLGQGDGQETAAVWAAVAQVHATLALAAAAPTATVTIATPRPQPAPPDKHFDLAGDPDGDHDYEAHVEGEAGDEYEPR